MRVQVQSLASLGGLGSNVAVSCGVGCKYGLDPSLLWLWYRPTAVALIQPLAWEVPYAAGAALKRKKQNKQNPQPHISKILLIFLNHGIRMWVKECG